MPDHNGPALVRSGQSVQGEGARATIDIDLNVFIPATRFDEVATPLSELGARADEPSVAELVRRDGQARVMWDATPIDLFFAYDAFHDAAGAARRQVTFADGSIPILAPEHLVVCKAVFNRPKDWVDIDAMLAVDTALDVAEVLRWVARIEGDEDPHPPVVGGSRRLAQRRRRAPRTSTRW